MDYAICPLAAAPLRKEPSHRSEMVNQLLFGDTFEMLQEEGEWFRIRTSYDQYEGWVTHHFVSAIDTQFIDSRQPFVVNEFLGKIRVAGQVIHIPFGSTLTGFQEASTQLWDPALTYEGQIKNTGVNFTMKSLVATATAWVNAPYLWGGKSILGVDCSGLIQTVFKINGIPLKRDAYEQQQQGMNVQDLSASQLGDLAFFNNEEGRVTHVGLLLADKRILHASGKVRIDLIDQDGIMNVESGKRTHRLHSIRRVIP